MADNSGRKIVSFAERYERLFSQGSADHTSPCELEEQRDDQPGGSETDEMDQGDIDAQLSSYDKWKELCFTDGDLSPSEECLVLPLEPSASPARKRLKPNEEPKEDLVGAASDSYVPNASFIES